MNSPNCSLTKEQVEKVVAFGTTHFNNVECIHADENFALVKWGASSEWWGQELHYNSPHVSRHSMEVLLDLFNREIFYFHAGTEVWNCARDADGRLTKNRREELIEREKGKPNAT